MQRGPEFYAKLLDSITDAVYFVDRERRITFWNRAAEELTGFSRDEVLGRSCADGILCHVDDGGRLLCEEGCPLARTIEDGEVREQEVYLRHCRGHRVPIEVSASPLHDEGGEIIGAVEVFRDSTSKLAAVRHLRELEELAYIDPLTKLGNRRSTEQAIRSRLHETARYEWSFGLLFIDLDEFKATNDRHGHATGDDLLRMVSRNLEGCLRVFDFAGRWGGEEFVALVVNVNVATLRDVAERFRTLVARSGLAVNGLRIGVTVSIGATLARPDDTVEGLVARADGLMYQSKARGRNRVTVDTEGAD